MLTFTEATHEYRWNGEVVPSVTQIIESGGLTPQYANGNYTQRGTAIHKVTELVDSGEIDLNAFFASDSQRSTDWQIGNEVRAYQQFLSEYAPQWVSAEMRLFHPSLRYAGTVDRLGIIAGKMSVLDIKCTQGGVQKHHRVQLSAYEMLIETATQHKPVDRYVLLLRRDGRYKLEALNPATNALDKAVFTGLVHKNYWLIGG